MQGEQNIITFKEGLPGLPELRKFTLVALQDSFLFYFLQSMEDENTCFILINPFALFPEYEFDLPAAEIKKIDSSSPENLAFFCIVNASKGLKDATVNLLAPVIVNTANKLARQVVLNDSRYSVRHPLPPIEKRGGG
ncbi:MAG: Flagellar assembly factor FliW [Pelotomaculum sp. PtaB.Bin104]|nr:MAG: Flagellar assembly factor FliW [Pelotomaculum sp. PtaB.Bin104]